MRLMIPALIKGNSKNFTNTQGFTAKKHRTDRHHKRRKSHEQVDKNEKNHQLDRPLLKIKNKYY